MSWCVCVCALLLVSMSLSCFSGKLKKLMSCTCGLNQDEVRFLHSENQVLLVGGNCQNPFADGSEGICGKPLGAHPLPQGDHFSVWFCAADRPHHCPS